VGPSRRTTPSPRAEAEPPPPRRWGRGLLWLGAILVLVAGAVAVSVIVKDPDDDAMNTAPLAAEQYCAEAASFRSFDELNLESDGAAQLRDLATTARRLASFSPPMIAADLQSVAQAFEAVATTVDELPADDPDGIATVTQSLDDELGAVQEQADRVGVYLDKWCGVPATADEPSTQPSTLRSTPETTTG
jgi:hypothetical protein